MSVVYIAGPMTGVEDFNFPAFDDAEKDLMDRGWAVISPASMDREHGFDPKKDSADAEMMQAVIDRDVDAILHKADALALLPGWEKSTGANAEIALAKWKGIKIYIYPDMNELHGEDGTTHPKALAGSRKDPLYLLPPIAKAAAARVHALGAEKYGKYNWRYQKVAISDYLSAMQRHIDSVVDGMDIDEESGEHHLAHVIAGCNIVLDAQHRGQLVEDRVLAPE